MSFKISEKTIERLILYRRILINLKNEHVTHLFSHQLAVMVGVTSAQLRRDLMAIGYSGSPVRGYDINALMKSISDFIDTESKQSVALVGVGHLGRAILDYFQGRRPSLEITMAFDNNPQKVNRVVHGCRCYHTDQLHELITAAKITVAILSVPVEEAQEMAEKLVHSGIMGILNYCPVKLDLPEDVFIENRDMIMAVEKVAYFSRERLNKGYNKNEFS
jgi:redox-sensing transcriptional repressor